jgi:hypothetical protein
MTAYSPPPLAVLLATLNVPSSSVSSVKPVLEALTVGSTKTRNADLEVVAPALPPVMTETQNATTATNAKRLITPPSLPEWV